MENPKSLLLLADTFCNRAEKSKIHSFFSYRTKKQGKIHIYMCFKRGQIIFLDHIWLFFLSRNLLIIRLLYIITFIWRLVPSCCWQEGGGFMCEFPQVMQIANLPDYIPLNWFISSWISINWKIEVGPAVINFNTQSMLFLIYQEYLQEHYTKNTKFRNPMQEREKRERRERSEREREGSCLIMHVQ